MTASYSRTPLQHFAVMSPCGEIADAHFFSRHWEIQADGVNFELVDGPGVVGHYPEVSRDSSQ